MTNNDILSKLAEPMPYKWKIQSYNKEQTKGSCVAYVDSRDVQNRLDQVLQLDWQDDYKEVKGNLYCGIGIKIEEEWIWRWDCGTESASEGKKGEASDSFKRAAVKWGLGRFLYDLDIKWIDIKDKKPIDSKGSIIWDLTKHFRGQDKKPSTTPKDIKNPNKPLEPDIKMICDLIDSAETKEEVNQLYSKYSKLKSNLEFQAAINRSKDRMSNTKMVEESL